MMKKYLKKDICLQKKDKKNVNDLSLIQEYSNGISKNNRIFRQRTKSTGLKKMMTHVERITIIVKPNLKLQC